MSGETQQILLVFIFLFSSCSFGLFTLSTIGSKWFSCRSNTPYIVNAQYDLIFTLWEYCQKTPSGNYVCASIDDASQFKDVFLDFKVLRVLSILCMVSSGILILSCLMLCIFQQKKICRRIVIVQSVVSMTTVVFGISSLVYAAARAQDIVGLDVRFTYGWSCVSSWIATIIAFLNAIMTLVLICVYLDRLTERMNQVRENLGMDNLSIRSNSLRRINNDVDDDESVRDEDIENIGAVPLEQLSQPPLYNNDEEIEHSPEENQVFPYGNLVISPSHDNNDDGKAHSTEVFHPFPLVVSQEEMTTTMNSSNGREQKFKIIDDEKTSPKVPADSNKSERFYEEPKSENASQMCEELKETEKKI